MAILAAVGEEDQEAIVKTAYDLAQAYDDELKVLHVIPREEAERHFEAIRRIDEFRDAGFTVEEDRARDIAETLVEVALGERPRNVSGVGRVGKPTEEILATMRSIDPRYLVIGGRKRSPTGKALFGSVTQSVILDASCPTVSVMPE